jgi:hypothetical protein
MADRELAIINQPQLPQTLEERKRQTNLTIDTAKYWATKIMEVVESCGLARSMGNKKYLEVEGWQIIAEFAQTKAIIEWTRPWKEEDGSLIGYEARCKLVDCEGNEVGAGESSCGLDAFPCRGKQGTEKDKAARSAAQTWAISRALRNKFSFVAKIAGYQAVPAEEMYTHSEPPEAPNGPRAPDPGQTPQPAPNVAPRARQSAKAALGDAILEYCNQDKRGASEVLQAVSGKSTLRDLTEQQAGVAMDKFRREYLDKIPTDDDIPEFHASRDVGEEG